MHSLVAIVYLVILLLHNRAALASPTKYENKFSLKVSSNGAGLTGPAGFRNTLLKHGRYIPPELDAAAEHPNEFIAAFLKASGDDVELSRKMVRSKSGSTAAEPVKEGIFTTEITVGNSKLNMDIDTGSSDLWVFTDLLPKNETGGHNLYNTSTGTKVPGYTWKIVYGDHTGASGLVYRDSVVIGGVTATSQAVEAATSISVPSDTGKNADGILGLAFKKLNQVRPEKQSTFWENVLPTLSKPVFVADFKHNAPGTLDFGYIDPKKYYGPISYSNVGEFFDGFWSFNFTSYRFNGTTLPVNPYNSTIPTGFLDTGTSYLVLTKTAADAYYKNVEGAKFIDYQWALPCRSKCPDFGLEVDGRYFEVAGDYVKQPLGSGICYGGIQGSLGEGSREDYGDIIGVPFIVSNLIVFDGGNKTLGFAHKHLHLKSQH